MKCNNENHKHEQDEWNCPLTPLDIAIRQSPSYLSQAPKEDILTKKLILSLLGTNFGSRVFPPL